MSSIHSLRSQLDLQFERTQRNMDKLVVNLEDASLDDVYAFSSAMRENATASWAMNQEVQVKHNLAKTIINEIR